MKCDKLQRYTLDIDYDENVISVQNDDGAYMDAYEVDAAIAELKQKLSEKDKEIESLKASHYAEMVDAGMRERRLRRLLWHAIALFCARSCEYFSGIMSHCLMGQDDLYRKCEEKKNKYLHAMYKCRAKAEEYK